MKYKVTQEQVKRVIPRLESALNGHFSNDNRICGFKIYLNDDDNPDELLDVYILISEEWSDNDNWSTFRIGHIVGGVREYLRDITPLTFEVYYFPNKCS